MSSRVSFAALLLLLGLCLVVLAPTRAFAQTPTDSEPVLGLSVLPPYQVGQVLDLFTAFRSGPADALNAELTVTATAGVTFLSVTAIHPTQPLSCTLNTPQEVVCTRAVVRGITEAIIEFRFDAPGDHTLTATVSQSNPDPNPDNNTLSGTIPVGEEATTGSISGTKWHDLNQDGQRDGNEPGLEGWTIYVDENGNGQPDGDEPLTTTRSDGTYQIDTLDPGIHAVRELLQAGWQQTFPGEDGTHTVTVNAGETTTGVDYGNYEVILTGVIAGQKFFDEDGDGQRDEGEPVLDGFTIYLDENGNGQRDADEPLFVTDMDGFYLFDEVQPGTHIVREEVPSGWTQTFPAEGQHVVTLNPGEEIGGLDFGNVEHLIAGQKFFDVDSDGVKDDGEPGLEDWTIYLDENGNGQHDPGEPSEVTNSAGEYLFNALVPGTYVVREVMQDGWTQTFPAEGQHVVTLNLGEHALDIDFGNVEPLAIGAIFGQKFFDENNNGAKDEGEPGLEGWTVYLDENGNGQRDADEPFEVTNPAGEYLFHELVPGTYTVREENQPGWTQTFPAEGQHVVMLNQGDEIGGIDFGNVVQLIFGQKFFDENNNGAKDVGEPGLEGWVIYLDENDNGQRDAGEPFEATNPAGEYLFEAVEPGTYVVREVQQDGWTQTFPGDGGAHTITVNPGQAVQNVDFGNYQLAMVADLGILLNTTPTSAGKAAETDTLGVSLGDTLDVEVTVDNNGPDDAEDVTITIRLDAEGNVIVLDTESIDACGGRASPSFPDGQTVTWDINQVDDGESVACRLKIFTVERGEGTINGTVTATTDDPDPSNNTAGLYTVVAEGAMADLAVDKSVSPDTVFVGETLTYTVSVLNRGPDDATNVRIRDVVFNDSLEFIPSSLPAGCTLTQNKGLLTCTLAALAPGQTTSLSYQALTKLAGGVTNFVDVASDLTDPDLENNITLARAYVSGGADVSVEKTVSSDTVGVGATLTYTVTVTNHGPELAFLVETDDLVFADSLEFVVASVPSNCTLGDATDDDTGQALATMTCRLAAILDPGDSATVTYQAITQQAGTVSNEVEVTAAPRDLNPENNIAIVTTVVEGNQTTIDFTLDASASTNTASVGDPVRFTFSCTANEPADACQVTATTNDAWTTPTLEGTFVIADGDTMGVAEGDTMGVEFDPEGFPAGTTRITYSFTGGFSEGGETYMGSFTLTADKPNPNATVRFEASAPNNDDPNEDDDIIEILVNIDALATAIEHNPDAVPQAFLLHANYPNPFNPETTIRFDVARTSPVRLAVYDLLGREVAVLVDEQKTAGSYTVVFDARDLASGMYLYQLRSEGFAQTRRLVLLK